MIQYMCVASRLDTARKKGLPAVAGVMSTPPMTFMYQPSEPGNMFIYLEKETMQL